MVGPDRRPNSPEPNVGGSVVLVTISGIGFLLAAAFSIPRLLDSDASGWAYAATACLALAGVLALVEASRRFKSR